VIRASPARVIPRLLSGRSTVIERNLNIVKTIPFSPTRFWQNNTGPGELIFTSAAAISITGEQRHTIAVAINRSKMRFSEDRDQLLNAT
jgi:hypothetical protein